MQPFQSFSFRIPAQRGKSAAKTGGVVDFLRRHDAIAPLLPTLKRHTELLRDCKASLPPMFDSCEIGGFEDDRLTLVLPNAALASKLRQQLPVLQSALQRRGWQINAIRLKLQVKPTETPQPRRRNRDLPQNALESFRELQGTLEDSRQNAALKEALAHLLARRQG